MPEGNIGDRVTASGDRRPGVEGPFACTIMSTRQPVRSAESLASRETPLADDPSMPDKLHTLGRQMALRKSDDRIVPLKREDQSRGSQPGRPRGYPAVQGRRSGQHAIQTPHRPHPVVEERCWTGWIASPNERKRIRRRRSTTSSRSRFYPLLRPEPRETVQAEKEDGQEEIQGEGPRFEELVPSAADAPVVRSMGDVECEAPGALSVLRRQ